MTELERMVVVIQAETKPLQEELKRVQKSLGGLEKTTKQAATKMKASFAKVAVGVAAVGYAVKKAVQSIGGLAKEAQEINAQSGNLSRTLGDNAAEFLNWAKTGATAYGISESAAVQYGNTFSTIISNFTDDTGQMSQLTQQMLETSAVVASKTGRTMDDVLTKIRSGLWGNTQAIDDLGINVKQSALEMTDAYKQIAGDQSWNQLNFNQQQAILYYGILEQATKNYGTTIDPVMQKQLELSAQLANLKTNLGNAFLPVVNVIIPILQHLVGWLNVAATYIRAFFELLFGVQGPISKTTQASNDLGIAIGNMGNGMVKSSKDAADNMDDSANSANNVNAGMSKAAKAAQKIKNMLAGFDELNILSEPSSDAGGSFSGGGIEIPTPDPDWGMDGLEDSANSFADAFDKVRIGIEKAKGEISDFIQRFKDGFKDLLPLIAGVVAGLLAFAAIKGFTGLEKFFANIPLMSKKFTAGAKSMSDALLQFTENNPKLSGLRDTLLKATTSVTAFAGKIGGLFGLSGGSAVVAGFAAIAAVIALVVAALVDFYNKSEEFREKVSTAIQGVMDIFTSLWEGTIKPIFDMVVAAALNVWEHGIKPLWDSFVNFIGAIATLLLNIWNSVLQPLIKWFVDTFGPIIAVVIGAVAAVFGVLLVAAGAIFGAILDVLTVVINWVSGFFEGTWKDVLGRIGGFFTGLWNIVTAVAGWIGDMLGGLLNGIWALVKWLWDRLVTLGGWIWDGLNWLWGGFEIFVGWVQDGLRFIINLFSAAWDGIVAIWSAVSTWFNENVIQPLVSFFSGLWDGIKNAASGAWNGIKAIWNGVKTWFSTNVVQPISNVFTGLWNGIKTIASNAWNGILDLFSKGGKIFSGIKDGIAGVFKTVVNSLISGINIIIAAPFKTVNGLLNTIREIGVLGVKPFKGLWSYNPLPVPQIPKLATGTNYVQREGLAYIHEGEAVVPKKYNPAAGGGGVEQIILLQEQNGLLRQLLEKDSGVYLDGKAITDNTVKNIKQRERLTGKPVFGL